MLYTTRPLLALQPLTCLATSVIAALIGGLTLTLTLTLTRSGVVGKLVQDYGVAVEVVVVEVREGVHSTHRVELVVGLLPLLL